MNILDWIKVKRTWYLYEPNGWNIRDSVFIKEMYGTEEQARKTKLLYSTTKLP